MMNDSEFRGRLAQSMDLAVGYLTEIAVSRENVPVGKRGAKLKLKSWIGAIKGEYRAATREFDSFCPLWHTGQAVKALVMAAGCGDREKLLDKAKFHAGFVLANQLTEGPDAGLLLGFEDHPGKDYVNTSAILESLDGLFMLSAATGDAGWRDGALAALRWVKENAWRPGQGVFDDLYDINNRRFVHGIQAAQGRPLLDDAVFLTGGRIAEDPALTEVALRTAETLLANEYPEGNWLKFGPCIVEEGRLHPRHAFWWGNPMLELFEATGDARFRDCFVRATDWYMRALRLDGGMFRDTDTEFNTLSFGHATSASAGAARMLLRCFRLTGEERYRDKALTALEFCMDMQFVEPADPLLRGAILEKVLPPGRSDASPYHIRDLGSIFFIQAAAEYLGISGK